MSNHLFNRHPFPVNCKHFDDDYKFKHRGFYRSEHIINCLCSSQNYPICIHCKGKRYSTTTNTPCLKSPITQSTSVEDMSIDQPHNHHNSQFNVQQFSQIINRRRQSIDKNHLSVTNFRPTSFDERQLRKNRLIPLNLLRTSIPVRSLDSSSSDKLKTFHETYSGDGSSVIHREKNAFLKSSSFNSFERDSYAIIDRPRSALEIYLNANSSGCTNNNNNNNLQMKSSASFLESKVNVERKVKKNNENVEIKKQQNEKIHNHNNNNNQKSIEQNVVEQINEFSIKMKKSNSNEIANTMKNDFLKLNENRAHKTCLPSNVCDVNINSDSSCSKPHEKYATEYGNEKLITDSSNSNTKPNAMVSTESPKKLNHNRANRRSKTRNENSGCSGGSGAAAAGTSSTLKFKKVYSLPSDESFTDEHSNESGSDDVFEPPTTVPKLANIMRRRRSSSLENIKLFQKTHNNQSIDRSQSNRSRSVVSINDKPHYLNEYNPIKYNPKRNASNSLPSIANRNLYFPNKSTDHSLVSIMSQPKCGPRKINIKYKTFNNDDDDDDDVDGKKCSNEYDIRDRIRGHGSDNGNQRFYRDNSEQDSLRGHTDRSKHLKDNDSFNRSTSTAEGTSEDKIGKIN